ncbi:TPA: hypothetical protein ACQJX5_005074 [Klebsiella pneumoniae]|uniref:Ead/Ea22-like protein n=2 Tax=Viruses TaxID=10239 RepID=A0AB39BZ90_9CAUD|nr:hypothetical protein [Klebsiella pneumoniae]
MTNITELAQRARINAECGEHLSPAETMELVEALESEKRICATWRKTAKSTGEKLEKTQAKADIYDMLRDDYGLREKGVGLADFVDWQAKRIAELESRTVIVKLPPKIERNDADGWFMYNCARVGGGAAEWYNKALDDVGAELTAAGIKVEAE